MNGINSTQSEQDLIKFMEEVLESRRTPPKNVRKSINDYLTKVEKVLDNFDKLPEILQTKDTKSKLQIF